MLFCISTYKIRRNIKGKCNSSLLSENHIILLFVALNLPFRFVFLRFLQLSLRKLLHFVIRVKITSNSLEHYTL